MRNGHTSRAGYGAVHRSDTDVGTAETPGTRGATLDLHLSALMQKAEVSTRPRDPVTRTEADTHPEQNTIATGTFSRAYQPATASVV
jgi:hypothetical protein